MLRRARAGLVEAAQRPCRRTGRSRPGRCTPPRSVGSTSTLSETSRPYISDEAGARRLLLGVGQRRPRRSRRRPARSRRSAASSTSGSARRRSRARRSRAAPRSTSRTVAGLALPSSRSRTSSARCADRRRSGRRAPRRAAGRRRRSGRSGTARPRRRRGRRRASALASSASTPSRSTRVEQLAPAATSGRRPAPRSRSSAPRADLAGQQRAEQLGPVVAGAGRVGQRPAQPRLAPQQAGHGEDLVGDRGQPRRLGAAGERVEPLGRGRVRLPADGLHQRRPPRRRGRPSSVRNRSTVPALAGLVGERLADDPAGQVDRERADLGAQLAHDGLPLGGELLLAGRDDPVATPRAPWPRMSCTDALGVGARLVADPGGLGAGLGELLPVLLEQPLASACASSARLMPPSIASTRAWNVSSMRGKTNFISTKQSTAKAIAPTMISCQIGMIGLCVARLLSGEDSSMGDLPVEGLESGAGLEDEAEGDAEQGERLDDGEADPDVRHGSCRPTRAGGRSTGCRPRR